VGYPSSQAAPRARPVADLPLDGLTGAGDELARAWAVALIVARPASAIAEVPLEDLARDGPRLCLQVLRALESEAELERLTETAAEDGRDEPALASRLASLAGAADVRSVVAAIEALRGVLWEALLGELRRPVLDRADAQLLADVADRLAYVCAMALAAALGAVAARDPGARAHDEVLVGGTETRPSPREPVAPTGPGGHGEVVIVDERRHSSSARATVVARARTSQATDAVGESAPPWSSTPAAEPAYHHERAPRDVAFEPPAAAAASPRERRESDGSPPAGPPLGVSEEIPSGEIPSGEIPSGEIHIRDERTEEGPAAWIRSIGRELERFALDGRPFAVLLIELMDAERLNRSEPPEEVLRVAGQVQRTLESELWTLSERAGASLTREAPGRFWMLAPGVDALHAASLAEQVAHAVRRSVSHRGQPVEIAVGTAVCPGDGVQAAALAAHADVALYAARADGSAGDGPAG
jgi:GGDEF domain-containing protein